MVLHCKTVAGGSLYVFVRQNGTRVDDTSDTAAYAADGEKRENNDS